MDKIDTVAVIGAGKMGLPLACALAQGGAKVIACDINKTVVDTINQGIAPFDEPGLADVLKDVVGRKQLKATIDTLQAVGESNVVIVIVPVLLTADRHADLAVINAVSQNIAQNMKPGTMISYETTLPVGGTRSLLPILESSGLKAGVDFDLVFSPERVKSQKVLANLCKTSKIVGGINEVAAERGAAFYARYLKAPIINVGSLEAAELVKLAGMVYRDVNIALANELARYADAVNVDIKSVLKAANTDGEASILEPGLGVGGHCTPVYPYFLLHDADKRCVSASLVGDSRLINDMQPAYVVDGLERKYGKIAGKAVLILGLAFRPQVKESILSPAFLLRHELESRGARVLLCDPLYNNDEIEYAGFVPSSLEAEVIPEILILNTAHDAFACPDFASLYKRGCRFIVDGRNFWQPQTVEAAALGYMGIGRQSTSSLPDAEEQEPFMALAKPVLASPEALAAASAIRSGWIMQGPQVAALEAEFAEYCGAPYATAVSSGTAALHLALLACGVEPGDEVITVSHSFIATANSIRYCGATPVFVDVDADTFNINPELVEKAISAKTKAILCVHQMGMPCDLQALLKIAAKHKLPLVEDAACAAGSEIQLNGQWERIGRPHADFACFSFHPRKLLTTGDGGMVTSKSSDKDRLLKQLRNHGLDNGAYPVVGFNYRMTDIQAAVGREQLKRLPGLVERRRRLAVVYKNLLSGLNEITVPNEPAWAKSNWQSFCIRLPSKHIRQHVSNILQSHGIETRPGIMCAHREGAYLDQSKLSQALKISEESQDFGLILPLQDQMSEDQVARVVSVIKDALIGVTG